VSFLPTTNTMLRIITLFFALSLILTVDAHIDTSLHRRHAPAANRMIKKRASGPLISGLTGGINNAAAAPQSAVNSGTPAAAGSASPATTNTDVTTPTDTQSGPTLELTPAPKSSASSPPTTSTATPSATQTSSASSLSVPNVVNTVISVLSPNASTSTSSSSSPSSASPSTTSTSSTPPSTPSPTQVITPTPDAQSPSSIGPLTITKSTMAAATTAASTSSNSGSVTKLQRNTIIILIAIGASIGAAGIIWTVIRKWKFSPSRSSEDRLQPIDWQPTTGLHEDHDITEKLARNGSTRSHGSFTSGNNNHDNLAPELPAHDFTAGPAHLAPVGGYADLQRGPSPQPDLQRAQSFRTQGDYQYEIPNPHGGPYYNGPTAPGVGAGAYQGGYDYNRGY